MNQKQLRQELAFLLNFTETNSDQDFVLNRMNRLLQQAYNQTIERAKLGASRAFFQATSTSFQWAASAQTLTVPTEILTANIYDIWDITNGEPGRSLTFGRDANDSSCDLFWYDQKHWQWSGVGGPAAAMTLRATYEKIAEDLDEDTGPTLIPPQFHWLIVWEAACLGRLGADEKLPQAWKEQRDDLFFDYCKYVAHGRPTSLISTVIPISSDDPGSIY